MSNGNKKYDRDILIPFHMRRNVEKFTPSFIKNDVRVKLLNKFGKNILKSGFRGYETCLIISILNINSNSEIINSIMKEVGEMFKNLEEKKVYALLINVFDVNVKNYSSLLPYSFFIHKGTDYLLLSNIIVKYLVLYTQRYEVINDLRLIFLIREWYNKKDISIKNNMISPAFTESGDNVIKEGEIKHTQYPAPRSEGVGGASEG